MAARGFLRRLRVEDSERRPLVCYRGDYVPIATVPEVCVQIAVEMATEIWAHPLVCPDCGGGLVWAEAGLVPGARRCSACEGIFCLEVDEDAV